MSGGAGFTLVCEKEFYATVGRQNVHLRVERDASFWETPSRQLLGIKTPGYMCEGPVSYRVESAFLARARGEQP